MGSNVQRVEGLGETRLQSLWLGKQWRGWCHENFLGRRLEVLTGAVRRCRRQGTEFAPWAVGDGAPEDFTSGTRPEKQKG